MTATYTVPERLALLIAGLVFVAVAAFGAIHVAPNRHLFPQNENVGTVGLYRSSILLVFGVWLVARGRREMRESEWLKVDEAIANLHVIDGKKWPPVPWKWEPIIPKQPTVEWSQRPGSVVDLTGSERSEEDFLNAPIDDHGYIDFGALRPRPLLPTVGSAVAPGPERVLSEAVSKVSASIAAGFSHMLDNLPSDDPKDELQRHLSDALAVLLREPSLTIDAGTLSMLTKHKAKAGPMRGKTAGSRARGLWKRWTTTRRGRASEYLTATRRGVSG
ncbi:hypothetical protein WHZ77_06055 [Bradyrhizobium sp. A5]|uniref:hypothetical protein n=1 Tax=Bradyrhizobium sp. A5 TaxID=3133696 RepID=UPI00324ECE1F